MFDHVDYVMVNVSDMSRSVAFYRDVLGLKLKLESPGWSEFETGTTTLALHGAPAPAAESGHRGEPVAGTCSIGFNVPDVQKAYDELKAKGARLVMPPMRREEEGIILSVCLDPDGLPVAIAQSLQAG
jgi:lactoylglutathione lyase